MDENRNNDFLTDETDGSATNAGCPPPTDGTASTGSEGQNIAESAVSHDADEPAESNAARLLRMRGISVEPEAPEEPVKHVGWLENVWYHYKSVILAVTAGIVILAIGIAQLVGRGTPEYYMMYAGPAYFNSAGTNEFIDAVRSLTDDENTNIALVTATCYTDEKIAEQQREFEERGMMFNFDRTFNNDEFERFRNEFMVGSSVIFLLDPELYEEMHDVGIFASLDSVLGYTPDSAVDDCAVLFSELEFAKYYPVFDSLPDDTLLTVRNVSPVAPYSGSREDISAAHNELFRRIVEFRFPDGYETDSDSSA